MELAVRTTIVLGLAFLIAGTLRRATPTTRHLLWHVTFTILVLAPALHAVTPHIPLPAWRARPALSSTSMDIESRASAESVSRTELAASATVDASTTCAAGSGPLSCVSSTTYVWLSGSLLAGAWFVVGWLASLSLTRRAAPAPHRLELEMRAVARDLRVMPSPRVRLSVSSRGPMTTGIFRPTILLPTIARAWHANRRRAVLAHELAHVRRADTRTQALVHVACALYWFNPLVWIAARTLRRERERACDDEVVALGIRPSAYAQDLLDIARWTSGRFTPSAAIAMARRSELESRLLSLLASDRRRAPARFSRWALPAAMGFAAVMALSGQPGAAQTARVAALARSASPSAPSPLIDVERQQRAEQHTRNAADSDTVWRSQDENARAGAASSLALSGDTSAIPSLTAALDDPSSQVREKAAIGLGLHSTPDVVEPLIRALQDADAQVRQKAAAGLMLRRDPRAVDALLVAIDDDDGQVREKAAIALGTSGDPRAAAALEPAARDPDAQVREKAVAGLALLQVTPRALAREQIEGGLSLMRTILGGHQP